MPFAEKYQLLEALSGEGIESFRARHVSNGREVTAHLLPGGKAAEETKALMARLVRLPWQARANLLEIGEYRGRSYVVLAAPPFLHFFAWLQAAESGIQTPPGNEIGATAPASVPAGSPPGEFTRMFGVASEPAEGAPAPVHASEPAGSPGEFTKLFGVQSQRSAAAAAESSQHQPLTGKSAEPGEFTRFFQMAPASPAPPPAATPSMGEWTRPPVAAAEPGEFERYFQTAAPSSAPAPIPSREEWATPSGKPAAPGEFTRIFGPGPSAAASRESASAAPSTPQTMAARQNQQPDPPPSQPAGPGIFARASEAAPLIGVALAANQLLKPVHAAPAPAGDFTRIFGGSGAESTDSSGYRDNQDSSSGLSIPGAPAVPSEYTVLTATAPPPASVASAAAGLAALSFAAPALPQMLPQMPSLSTPPASAAPAAAQPGSAPVPILPLIIAALLGFLAGALVTFLIMRR